jgi:hypothetical protein
MSPLTSDFRRILTPCRGPSGPLGVGRGAGMADLAYVLLIMGVFLLPALGARGPGKL